MPIDTPRIQPIVTPPAVALDDEVRVRRAAAAARLKAEPERPVVERRVQPERRQRRDKRNGPLELRARRDRRAASRVELDA
ncbi:MAG: hypothetical protein CALGDGBN_01478 [Pseudomonadales bacterium]|nr:hypothetical protein [Pseudomonadales bacterium]